MNVVWLSDFEESFQSSGVPGIVHAQCSKPGADRSCSSEPTLALDTSETQRLGLVRAALALKKLYTR